MKQLNYFLQWRTSGEVSKEHVEEQITEMVDEKLSMEDHGKLILERFNRGLKPGERERVFVGVRLAHEAGKLAHVWEKKSLMTEKGGYDIMRCPNCGATAKRFGLGRAPTIDAKFKKFADNCPNTLNKKVEIAEVEEDPIPTNAVELQEFMEKLYEEIMQEEVEPKEKIKVYNEAAKRYNKIATFEACIIISNFKQQKIMATKKAAAPKKKAAPKKAAKKAAVKKGSAKAAPKKAAKVKGEKGPTQKETIVELAGKGKTIDEIVDLTGIKKTNVQWWFSKLRLKKGKKGE